MANVHGSPRNDAFLSQPVRIYFAGFESDTWKLQEAGWSLSAEQDIMSQSMRLAMRHEGLQLYGISDHQRWDYWDRMGGRMPPLFVRHMAARMYVQMIESAPFSFEPIDARPMYAPSRTSRIEDLVHFAPAMVRTKEIILPEASVPQLMDQILKLQEPGRQERLKQQLAEEREGIRLDAIPRQKFHAQILSIAA